MPKRQPSLYIETLCLVLVAGFLVGCSRSDEKGMMLASYDGGKITEHEFRQAITNLPERVREAALIQKEDFLDSLVIEKLLLQEAESRGLQHSAEVEAVLSQARQRILVAKLIEDEVELKADVDADEVKTYYDNHRDEVTCWNPRMAATRF